MRTAELKDLKVGQELINEYGTWIITEYNEVDGWIIKGISGSKILVEHEIKYYTVNE